jgi:XTP/dITP diphosphohydrolase
MVDAVRRFLLGSKSAGKLRELRQMTADSGVEWLSLDDFPNVAEAVEDGNTFRDNAEKKARHYAQATGLPTLADDSGLEVDALRGAPGVHSAYYAGLPRDDAANNRKLVADLARVPPEQRTARFRCVMVFVDNDKMICEASGAVEGMIIDQPRGVNGFGYDPHFYVPATGCTTAELPPEEKNRISHRGQALRAMLAQLSTIYPPMR